MRDVSERRGIGMELLEAKMKITQDSVCTCLLRTSEGMQNCLQNLEDLNVDHYILLNILLSGLY